jgi:hypothetical protein
MIGSDSCKFAYVGTRPYEGIVRPCVNAIKRQHREP